MFVSGRGIRAAKTKVLISEADLRLCFRICRFLVFPCGVLYVFQAFIAVEKSFFESIDEQLAARTTLQLQLPEVGIFRLSEKMAMTSSIILPVNSRVQRVN